MAITQSDAASLSNDLLVRGVIETIVRESAILQYLPFMPVTGTAVRYNREATMPAAAFYDVGDTWQEATPTFSEHVATLKILGGDADVDNFLQSTYADANDIEAEVIASRAKAVAHAFSQTFVTGDSGTDTKAFDGLQSVVGGSQTISMGANGSALTLARLDEMIDLVKPGKPELLLMSKRSRRKLKDLRRTSGSVIETAMNQFGQQVEFYDGIPLVVDDFVPNDETQGTASDTSSIWALKFGQGMGLMGLEHNGITVERVGEELETGFVEADDREGGVDGAMIDIQHILHVPDELGVGLRRNAPLLLQPRFERVCFKVCRTDSWEIVSTTSSRTRSSASRRTVQRSRPAGGVPQAMATM